MICIECGEEAKYVRCTQFAGEHPYCEFHAKIEKDFDLDSSDSYTYWKKLGEIGEHIS